MNNMKVSVIMMTYNHQDFIEDAIKGVLMQKTDFDFHLIVSNDVSNDASHEVIENYLVKHPQKDKVTNYYHLENKGMVGNALWCINQSQSEYIAICEGDDIWTDPYKLQKQVEILDKNPEYSMVCGDVNIVDEQGKFVRRRFSFEKDFGIDSNYLLKNNHITTCTVMIRKSSLDLSVVVSGINFLDKFLWLSLLSKGSCYFLNDVLSSYRIHSGGIYSKLREYQKSLKRLEDYSKMKRIFPHLKSVLNKQMKSNVKMGILSSIKHRQFKSFVRIITFLFQ